MAMRVAEITVGIDVAKRWLDVAAGEDEPLQRIENTAQGIEQWLRGLNTVVRLAVEPTGQYHEVLVQCAQQAGHRVYLIDPLRLSRYRDAVGQRAKTDQHDAQLLRRYLIQEAAHLRPWAGLDPRCQRLWRLLKRRAAVVRAGVQMRQSLGAVAELQAAAAAVFAQLRVLLCWIDRQLRAQARALGWTDELVRLQAVPGIGALTALGLVSAYRRGQFTSADCFVAFLGLDIRVRHSGLYRGRGKLTKKGEPEIRRLLYNAAMAARRYAPWRDYYLRLRDRGMSTTAALVALSRKLVRLAYAMLRDQTLFDPDRRGTCMPT